MPKLELTQNLIDEVRALNKEYNRAHEDTTCPLGVLIAQYLDGLAKHVVIKYRDVCQTPTEVKVLYNIALIPRDGIVLEPNTFVATGINCDKAQIIDIPDIIPRRP